MKLFFAPFNAVGRLNQVNLPAVLSLTNSKFEGKQYFPETDFFTRDFVASSAEIDNIIDKKCIPSLTDLRLDW